MENIEQYLKGKLQEREEAGNLRTLKQQYAAVDFFSNDYLGLATAGTTALSLNNDLKNRPGPGSTGSRLLSGNSIAAEELEHTIAAFHKAEAALLFNSGYDANIGLISGVANRHTTIYYDELCHASIIDGIRLSQAAYKFKFAHNSVADLQQKIAKAKNTGVIMVVAEAVYSMDGDLAPLKDIADVTAAHGGMLIVDEAHAAGVFGKNGSGLVSGDQELREKVFARVHTFGKALGCHGAAIVGSQLLKQYLINFARTFIYTTALPPHSVAAIGDAYRYLSGPDFTNSKLHELIAYFREKISTERYAGWKDSISPIQALIIGGNDATRQAALALQKAGLQVNPILHPTVPAGEERLRVCLHAFNTREQVDLLFATLKLSGCVQ